MKNFLIIIFSMFLFFISINNCVFANSNSKKLDIDRVNINKKMLISKIIDNNFSLDMDLDINSKKQIRPKVNVIQEYKPETTSKCVEKVMTPHLKKYRVKNNQIVEDTENIDIDKISDLDEYFGMVNKKKNIVKEKPAKVVKSEPNVVKEKPVKVVKSEPKVVKEKPAKVVKSEPKVVKEKPVKVVKSEPKVVKEKPAKVVKSEPNVVKEKPVKVVKSEPKVVKEKPVKVVKSEPKVVKEKPVKVVKSEPKVVKEKPVKVVVKKQKSNEEYFIPTVYDQNNTYQDMLEHSSFELMQNRMPLTRNDFEEW